MNLDMNVLVVDDFSTMRRIVKKSLTIMGFKNIIEVEDGKDALDVLAKEDIGLILSDWNMPVMMGIDLLKAVRGDEKLKKIPFIMVTAEGQKNNIMAAVEAGVSNYIVKPFTPDILKEKIQKILK